eukprot:12305755-Prorocentrum_lima.AAC.1
MLRMPSQWRQDVSWTVVLGPYCPWAKACSSSPAARLYTCATGLEPGRTGWSQSSVPCSAVLESR